jgi:formylmethanofuran dehydrogenase subunit E
MKKQSLILILLPIIAVLTFAKLFGHDDETPAAKSSAPGSNFWNTAQEPTNWWNEINQAHGHVGPWNVLGWRMGKAALRELNAAWGQHELDVVCHIPLSTPYSCLADGLVVGTGNSIGRLDIRLAEALAMSDVHVSVRRKDGTGPVLLLKPDSAYLEKIRSQPDEQLDALARECGLLPEKKLFVIEKLQQPGKSTKSPSS